MRIDSESRKGGAAASAARAEAEQWAAVADVWGGDAHPEISADLAPRERLVTGFDPHRDLSRRAEAWQHHLPDDSLATLCRFAAGLAAAEAAAWTEDQPHIATRAYSDRRFLVGDRIVLWAVPWLDTAGRCFSVRGEAHGARDLILGITDHHRPAPDVGGGSEGMYLPGHDSLGPLDVGDLATRLGSLLGGAILFDATLCSMTGDAAASRHDLPRYLTSPSFRRDLVVHYDVTAARWRRLADDHPGTARLWVDLSARAAATRDRVAGV